MLNRNTDDPNHAFHERVCQYRAKLILHDGFNAYRRKHRDTLEEIAAYIGWSESKLRSSVYHNFYPRKTDDIKLLCRLFDCDVLDATRPYCADRDCDLAVEVMALDDERSEKAGNVEPLFPEDGIQNDLDTTAIPRWPYRNCELEEMGSSLSDEQLCTLVSLRAGTMSQSNLLELTKDLMNFGMMRGSQVSIPEPCFE